MANPHRGEVSFDHEGKTYTMMFNANSICELEGMLDRSFISISNDMASWSNDSNRMRMSVIRAVFWASLRKKQPDIGLMEAGELMLEIGGLVRVMQLISDAFSAAFPDPDKESNARPPVMKSGPAPPGLEKKDGTGRASSAAG